MSHKVIVITIDGKATTFTQPGDIDNDGRVFELAREWLKDQHTATMKEQGARRRAEHIAAQVKRLRDAGKAAQADALERGDLAAFFAGGAVTAIAPDPVVVKGTAKGAM